jgi:hypothetical protein
MSARWEIWEQMYRAEYFVDSLHYRHIGQPEKLAKNGDEPPRVAYKLSPSADGLSVIGCRVAGCAGG